jgi:hypothetical protein
VDHEDHAVDVDLDRGEREYLSKFDRLIDRTVIKPVIA